MRKIFNLQLWPSKEEKRRKQRYNEQQRQSAFPPNTGGGGGGGVVVDGVDGESGGRRLFGIRNYLHHFYFMSPSPTVEEIVVGGGISGSPSGGQWYLLPPPPSQRMGLYVCRLMSILGLLLLLGGAAAIVVGYSWPHYAPNNIEASLMRIAIDQDEEGNFYIPPERLSEILRDPMHGVKMSGFCVFAIGASIMALSLLVPTFAHCSGGTHGRLAAFASEDNTPNEPPVRIYPAAGVGGKFRVSPAKPTGAHKISPTSGPVPVMEEISKVQPGGKKSPSPPAYSPSDPVAELLGAKSPDRDNSPLLR